MRPDQLSRSAVSDSSVISGWGGVYKRPHARDACRRSAGAYRTLENDVVQQRKN